MDDIYALFPETYEDSRARFRQDLAAVQRSWPDAALSQHRLSSDEDLTIDWIHADALVTKEKVLILTTGEHGVEGYVGSAMLQRFIDKFLSRLDPRTTGLLLVHAINPWGMKHHRRVNVNNVDLNRNFLYDRSFDPAFNSDYDRLDGRLNPKGEIKNLAVSKAGFYIELFWRLLTEGTAKLKYTVQVGQYRRSHGIFYGGQELQMETRLMMDLYRKAFGDYGQVLHLDMHTGYGPRYQMSLVNSALDSRTSGEFVERFKYPLVVAANPLEFYAVQGDMIDYVYTLRDAEFPGTRLYSTSFEFGTLGDSWYGQAGCPRAVIYENRLFWHGAASDEEARQVKHDFEELFNPAADDWRCKAVEDADQAFEGILKAEEYL